MKYQCLFYGKYIETASNCRLLTFLPSMLSLLMYLDINNFPFYLSESNLTITTSWTYSADDKWIVLVFPRK